MKWLMLALLVGCGDGTESTADLSAPADFAVGGDLASLPDLAPWCVAGGAAPACNGAPCAPGCWCDLASTDGGAGAGLSCICNRAAPPSSDTGDPLHQIHCCGGVYCPFSKGLPLECSPQNNCTY